MDRGLIERIADGPKIIGVVGDVNTGKTMFLYNLIADLQALGAFNLFTYGLRMAIDGSRQLYSLDELEKVTNSVIIVDEVMTLFDFDNRMDKRSIENTLRLIHHNNNILILCFVPENIKKFIAGKLNMVIVKRTTLADLINGSKTKQLITAYKGPEMGSAVLGLAVDEALVYDGDHYMKVQVDYLPEYDTKLANEPIVKQNVIKNVKKSVKGSV